MKLLKYPFKIDTISAEEFSSKHPEIIEQLEIYPETVVYCPQPRAFEENNAFESKEVTIPQMNVAKIKNGKCYTQNGLVLTSNNKALTDYTPLEEHPLRNKRHYKFQKPEKIEGAVAVLTNDSCQKNYYHWLIESASRLHLIEKSGFKVDKYIINNECTYQKKVLALLGIPEDQIIKIEPNRLIQADELIIPSIVNYFEEIKTEKRDYFNAKFVAPWVIEFYREKFLPLVAETEPKKIYISRKKAPYRKVENEDELMEYLEKHGFESYCLEDLDFLEQVELFYNATHVFSAHGAGLTNIMFCKKNTKVYEFFDPGYLYQGQQMIALNLNLDYICSYIKTTITNNPGFEPIIFDIEKLRL